MEIIYFFIGGIIAIIASIWAAYTEGAKVARAKERADSYEKYLQDISDAHAARNSVTDSLPDKDKYRRD